MRLLTEVVFTVVIGTSGVVISYLLIIVSGAYSLLKWDVKEKTQFTRITLTIMKLTNQNVKWKDARKKYE